MTTPLTNSRLCAVARLLPLLLFTSFAFAQTPAPATPGTESYSVIAQTGVRVKMRDGVTLAADIYRPKAEGKFPVILTRTPYNRKDAATGIFLASHGYVVIHQDTRGRFDSGGEFYPFKNEMNDGYDTIEWAASLPYADGRVGTYGGSYVGATQMLAAASNPPHLVGIFPYVTAAEYYEGWTYEGGALMQWFASSWTSGLAVDTLQRKTSALTRSKEWVEKLPVEEYRLVSLPTVSDVAPYFRDWVEHETSDDFWRAIKISDHYGKMNIKALHAGGWHDIFSGGSIRNFIDLRKQAPTADARNGQRLLMGAWAHAATSPEGKIGDVTFGKHAVLDMNGMILKWYDYVMKGKQNEFATSAPVKIFVMGDNVWRDEQEFPLARTQSTRYYLRSAKGANSLNGDGVISTVAPKTEKPDSFEYDPANPVPTIGGRLYCGAALPPGPFDQRPNESRSDVLVYSTPPLEQDTEVTGFITAELYASTSAADTDFTAMIVDVDQSGYARYLGDGIIRARYRNSTAKAEPLEAGKIYKYTIDLWATSNVFKAGHRIRVYISSSNFPRFNRNLNTGEKTYGATRMEKARQTIYHDADHPSAIILPIIPKGKQARND
jgi:putative CocE/NonD family hydrolase